MTARLIRGASIVPIAAVLAFCMLITAAPVWAQATTPDLTGTWQGCFKIKGEKGPDSKGTAELYVGQSGAVGSFDGVAVTKDYSATIPFTGSYAMTNRKMSGTIAVYPPGQPPEIDAFAGKCNKKETKLKLKIFTADGSKVKMKLKKIGI